MTVIQFVQSFDFYKKASILQEFGHSEDNFLLSPDGQEIHCPGQSHTGVAQNLLAQRGVSQDPDRALDTLLKQGWIRISGTTFELFGFTAQKKAVMGTFIRRHGDLYENAETIEIDNRKKGYSKQFPITSFVAEGEDQAAERASEFVTMQQGPAERQAPKGYVPEYIRNAPELVRQRFREGD